ncbi:MAG: GPR endopeptidase [Erysipelotrichales bacterium]|nr:GPR endopeptidase [Erysipelotrichales bacterium]
MKINDLFKNDIADELIKKKKSDPISIKHFKEYGAKITQIEIKDKNNKYAKEVGNYITIECTNDHNNEEVLAKYLKKILKKNGFNSKSKVLVVGLGNDSYLSDALGPKVIKEINVTSHLKKKKITSVSCFIPGVMGVTGLESSAMIKSIIDRFSIDIVIVIDSLATRSISRLYKTYQLTDTGINPGSGVNNNRMGVNKKIMKIPVVAIGVATVVDVASIMVNTLNVIDKNLLNTNTIETIYNSLDRDNHNFIMTTKEIDDLIDVIALNIASGINLAINPTLAINDNLR